MARILAAAAGRSQSVILLSLFLPTGLIHPALAVQGEYTKHKFHPVGDPNSRKNAFQISAHRGKAQSKLNGHLFVGFASQDRFNDPLLLGREFQLDGNFPPDTAIAREWDRNRIGLVPRSHEEFLNKKRGRQTKAAHGTSARRHAERALADTPLRGRDTKALLLQVKMS